MKLFNSEKNNQVIARIRATNQNFVFDHQRQKDRLLLALSSPQPPKDEHWASYGFTFKFSAGIAITILAASATFLTAQGAAPGDTLFPVNKLREKILLALPLATLKRVEVTAGIAQERFDALDQIPAAVPDQIERKIQTVQETQESFQQAVEVISRKQADLEEAGRTEAADTLDRVLTNLNQMAQEHETLIEQLAEQAEDESVQTKIRSDLQLFRQTRQKAEEQLNRHRKTENRSE